MDIKVITNWDELHKLKNDWRGLVELDPYATIFQSYEWTEAWRDTFSHTAKPYIVSVSKNSQLLALAPLIKQDDIIKFITSPLNESEYNEFIVEPSHAELRNELAKYLFRENSGSHFELSNVRLTSPLTPILRKFSDADKNSHVTESASMQMHLNGRINKRDIRSRRNRLSRHGQLSLTQPNSNEIRPALDRFFSWHRTRFGHSLSRYRRLQTKPEFQKFYENLERSLNGRTNISTLELDHEPISYMFTLQHAKTLYDLLPSYNHLLQHFSPGSILLQDTINEAVENGTISFDMLQGSESYKLRFANASTPLRTFTFYPSSFKKLKSRTIFVAIQLLKPFISRLIDIINIFNLTKRVVFFLIYYSGLSSLYQRLTKNRLRILNYHSISDHPLSHPVLTVSTATFANQMDYVRDLQLKFYNLQLTFDDGYQDNYSNAYPILQKYSLTATVFPTTNFIEQGSVPSWDGEPQFPALSWDEIKQMTDSNTFNIGSHTVSHPSLGDLNDQEVKSELTNSRLILESKIACPPKLESGDCGRENCKFKINSITYPYGKKKDATLRVKKIAKDLGYTHGYTLTEGTNPEPSGLSLKRLVIFDEPIFMFKVRVSGILDDFLSLFRN